MKINTKRNTDRSLVTLCKICRKSTISQQLNHRLLRKLTRCTFLWLVYVLCIVYTRSQKRWLLNNMFRERWYPKTLWEMLHNFHDSWQTSVHDNCFLSGKWVWLPSYKLLGLIIDCLLSVNGYAIECIARKDHSKHFYQNATIHSVFKLDIYRSSYILFTA